MSLNSISNDMVVRDLPREAAMEADSAASSRTGAEQAFDSLAKFIPTEMLAPYVAAISLIVTDAVNWNPSTVYWLFVLATPLVFLLFHYAKIAMDPNLTWPSRSEMPLVIWGAVAAMLAFAIWAIAVPGNEIQALIGGAGVAGLLAVVVSPVLSAINAIVIRLIKPSAT